MAPGNVVVDTLNSTAINISWEVIPLISRNGIITEYEVLYEPLETFEWRLLSNQLNSSDIFLLLNNLQESVEYNISVRAYTSVGPGPYSDEELGVTLEDRKCMICLHVSHVQSAYILPFYVQVLVDHRRMLQQWLHHQPLSWCHGTLSVQ